MLIWRPGNFKILLVGDQVDVIPMVERRIGRVISLPVDIHRFSLEELKAEKVEVPPLDLIIVDKVHEEQFQTVYQSQIFSDKDFIPSLMFQLGDKDSDEEIEFLP